MSRLIAIILFGSLLLQCLARFSVMGLYELRKDVIAKTLCENRARPELKCCGRCVLNKQLQKADDAGGDSKHLPPKAEKAEALACVLPPRIDLGPGSAAPSCKPYNPVLRQLADTRRPVSIFHPPPAAA